MGVRRWKEKNGADDVLAAVKTSSTKTAENCIVSRISNFMTGLDLRRIPPHRHKFASRIARNDSIP